MTALVPITDMHQMAVAFSKGGLFGAKSVDQCMSLLLLAQADGVHPARAMRDFDVISGRPAKRAEAMLRDFIDAGGKVEWHVMTDERAEATFSHPQGGSARIDWDMSRAKKAGLGGRDMYSKYPRQMLANRVISEGCRRIYPASTSGMYVPEEVRQFLKEDKKTERDMGAADVVPDADDDALKGLEQPAGAPEPETAGAAPPPPATTPPQAPPKLRAQVAEELCRDANINFPDATAKAYATAKVQHWDEMAESDWDSWVAMMRRGITRRMVRKTAETQP